MKVVDFRFKTFETIGTLEILAGQFPQLSFSRIELESLASHFFVQSLVFNAELLIFNMYSRRVLFGALEYFYPVISFREISIQCRDRALQRLIDTIGFVISARRLFELDLACLELVSEVVDAFAQLLDLYLRTHQTTLLLLVFG